MIPPGLVFFEKNVFVLAWPMIAHKLARFQNLIVLNSRIVTRKSQLFSSLRTAFSADVTRRCEAVGYPADRFDVFPNAAHSGLL